MNILSTGMRRTQWTLLLVYLILSLGIGATGFLYYSQQRQQFVEDKKHELMAIGQLKVNQIRNWRKERLGDALSIQSNAMISKNIKDWIKNPDDPQKKNDIAIWLESLKLYYGYRNAYLLDIHNNILNSDRSGDKTLGQAALKLTRRACLDKEIIFSDLYRDTLNENIHIDIAIPLMDRAEEESGAFAVVLLRIDPYQFLFPVLQTWPTPSQSGETLVVRREGDEVLYLNELRHDPNAALNLRIPINRTDLPAVQAVLEKQDVIEGIDYRSVPVLASLHNIPESPWFLVAKIDQDEVYAPIRQMSQNILIIAASLIVTAGTITGFLWRRQALEYLHERYKTKLEREALLERLNYLIQNANDIIFTLDSNGRIIEANESAVQAYGYTHEELLNMEARQLRTQESPRDYDQMFAQVRHKSGAVFETIHQRKDGTTFPVEISVRINRIENELYYQSIIRDISERKRAEEALQKANRALRTLSECGQVLIHSADESLLLQKICQIIVDVGGYRLAWVGFAQQDDGDKLVQPVAYAGFEQGYLQTANITWAETERGRGPAGSSIRTGKPVVVQDIDHDPDYAPWRTGAIQRGYAAAIAVPLIADNRGQAFGSLNIYAGEVNAFSAEEISLLTELAGEIAFGITSLRTRQARQNAENLLRHNAIRFEALAEISQELIANSANIEKTLEIAVQKIAKTVGDFCIIHTLSIEGLETEKAIFHHRLPEVDQSQQVLFKELAVPIRAEISPLVLKEGKTFYFPHLTATSISQLFPQQYHALVEKLNIHSLMVVPLRVHNKICGAISVYRDQSQTYAQEDQILLQDLSDRIGLAISNASLYFEVQRYSASLEQRVTERTAQLEAANQELEAFSYSVSHDLRAPLRAIDGFSRIILEEYATVDPAAQHYLELVRKNTKQMSQLIDDLLAFSRLGRKEPTLQKVSPGDVVQQVLQELEFEQKEHRPQISIYEMPVCYADPALLKQVYINLITNAIKFTRLRQNAKIEIGWLTSSEVILPSNVIIGKNSVIYYVRDNGVGFDMRFAHKLFGVFQRLHRSEDYEGTGVGLAIVNRIIKRHNGVIWAQAEPDQGATFYFILGDTHYV